MKKYNYVFLLCIFVTSSNFCVVGIKKQLKALRTALSQLLDELEKPQEGDDIRTDQFITRISNAHKPRIISSLLLGQLGVSTDVSQQEIDSRTPEELQQHQELRADFSDLLQELEQHKNARALRAILTRKLQTLFAQQEVSQPEVTQEEKQEQESKTQSLDEKIDLLIRTIERSSTPLEFFRKLLIEELAELPPLPEREDGIVIDPNENAEIHSLFTTIMKEILAFKDFVGVRNSLIEQLKKAYYLAINQAKGQEKEEEVIQGEQEEEAPEVPPRPEEVVEETEEEQQQREIKQALEKRRKAIEGEDEDEEEEDEGEYFIWD